MHVYLHAISIQPFSCQFWKASFEDAIKAFLFTLLLHHTFLAFSLYVLEPCQAIASTSSLLKRGLLRFCLEEEVGSGKKWDWKGEKVAKYKISRGNNENAWMERENDWERTKGVGKQEKEEGKIIQYNKANIVQAERQLKNYSGIEGNTAQLMRMLSASALCSLLFLFASKACAMHG